VSLVNNTEKHVALSAMSEACLVDVLARYA